MYCEDLIPAFYLHIAVCIKAWILQLYKITGAHVFIYLQRKAWKHEFIKRCSPHSQRGQQNPFSNCSNFYFIQWTLWNFIYMVVDLIVYAFVATCAPWCSLHRCKSFLQEIAKPSNRQICIKCYHNEGLNTNGVSLSMSVELGTTTIMKVNILIFEIDFIFKAQRHNSHTAAACRRLLHSNQGVGVGEGAFLQIAVVGVSSHSDGPLAGPQEVVEENVVVMDRQLQHVVGHGLGVPELLVPPGVGVVVSDRCFAQVSRSAGHLHVAISGSK